MLEGDELALRPGVRELIEAFDQRARSAEAGRFIAYAEARAKAGRAIRDNAIREMRQLGLTVPAIATAAGVSTATVKQVIR